MTAPTAPPTVLDAPVAVPSQRIHGVDVARALAIIGMISVHVAPPLAGQGGWYALPYGRSSMLFALVAGVGIAIQSARSTWGEQASRLAWRCLWLVPVGVLLSKAGTPVAVILQYYGLWFLLCIPVFRLPTRWLAPLTAVGMVLGPTFLQRTQLAHPEWYTFPRGAWLGEVGDVLLTGYYPTVSWIWIVFTGILIGRLPLARRVVQAALAIGGSAVATAAYTLGAFGRDTLDLGRWQLLLDTTGHADGTLEQLASGGVAVGVLGLCLLVAGVAPAAMLPLRQLGRFALSVYVGHIVVYAFARSSMYSHTPVEGATTTLVVSAVSTVIAMVWLAVGRRGPLEALDRSGHRRLILPAVRRLEG